jgi:hypothetical protein
MTDNSSGGQENPSGHASKIGTSYTLNELRGILSDEIEKLRTDKGTAQTANAISNACGKILSSVKLELEAYKMMGRKPTALASIAGITEAVSEEKPAATAS